MIYLIIAAWAIIAFSTTLTVIIIRTRQVKEVVKSATDSLEKRVDSGLATLEKGLDDGLEKIQVQSRDAIRDLDTKLSTKMEAIAIPEIPDDLGKTLADIYDAIPGQEDWDALTENIAGSMAQLMASADGVRQKAIMEYLSKTEAGFTEMNDEMKEKLISQADITDVALHELMNIEVSKKFAKSNPYSTAILNTIKATGAQGLMSLRQQRKPGQHGNVTIERGGSSSGYSPGFNP